MITRRDTLSLTLGLGQFDDPRACDVALARLLAGNGRYAQGKSIHPEQDPRRRESLNAGQNPFAVIIGCSDSRVPPEIVFDEGLGELFVIRNAGHVIDNAVLGSVEYAVSHLGVSLVVVLGHSKCGAVSAAINHAREAHLRTIVAAIAPAVREAAKLKGDLIRNTIDRNVMRAVTTLSGSAPLLNRRVADGKLRIEGMVYSLDQGTVRHLAPQSVNPKGREKDA
jgi:carbonic anhydrase